MTAASGLEDFRMVASCSLVGLPVSVFTSKAQNRPSTQAMIGFPPCTFCSFSYAKQRHSLQIFHDCFYDVFSSILVSSMVTT